MSCISLSRSIRLGLTLLSAALCFHPRAALAAPDVFAGVVEMRFSVGAPPERRQGVCAIDLPAVEADMADRLSRAGIRSASAWETFVVFRQNLQEAEREQAHFRREGRFPAEAAANRARRAATEERLTAQPVIALGLVSAPVVALSGKSACALALHMRISVRGEPPRNVIAATGHESRRSLQL